jgi:hypothetical protein
MHVQPSTDYPIAWQWTPTQLRAARFTPTASSMARNVFPASSSDKSQREFVSQSHAVAGSSIPMAVSLTPHLAHDEPLVLPSVLPSPISQRGAYPVPPPTATRLPDIVPPSGRALANFAREKKHGCWMCHKSFDRPSTLRKVSHHPIPPCLQTDIFVLVQHLLVHTGDRGTSMHRPCVPRLTPLMNPFSPCLRNLRTTVWRCIQSESPRQAMPPTSRSFITYETS